MHTRLTSTFGETVTHNPTASGVASQSLTMIPEDPSMDGDAVPGAFLVLSAPTSAFTTIPVEGDTVTFRSTEFKVFAVTADLGGLTKISLTTIT